MNAKKHAKRKSVRGKKTQLNFDTIERLLIQQSGVAKTPPIFEPTPESLARLKAIPLLFEEPGQVISKEGAVVYDSWAQGPTVALRDMSDGHIRRLQLQAGKVSCEIVAELSRGRWEFVARAYRGNTVAHDFVIGVGGKKLLSESGGFYRWSSKGVPRKISLTSQQERFTFERLSW